MEKLTDKSCAEFLEALASAAPTPGGGGAAALAGALGAALSSMVGNLTIGKEKFAAREAEVKELTAAADTLRAELLALVAADAAVFGKFMSCYKLPKASEEEKAARTQAIRKAAKEAAGVPLDIARASVKVLELANRLAVIGNPGVVTDGACSAILARAALRCAVYNVIINLGLTKDEVFNQAAKEELKNLQQQAAELEKQVLDYTDNILA